MDIHELRRKKLEEIRKSLEAGRMKKEENRSEIEIEVNDENFQQEVIEKSKKVPVVVDFWAGWCMPCMMLAPILEKLAHEYNGKFVLAKLNVDNAPITAQSYGVMSIPTVKMFKDGKVVDEFVGAMPEEMVRAWLDKNLS